MIHINDVITKSPNQVCVYFVFSLTLSHKLPVFFVFAFNLVVFAMQFADDLWAAIYARSTVCKYEYF